MSSSFEMLSKPSNKTGDNSNIKKKQPSLQRFSDNGVNLCNVPQPANEILHTLGTPLNQKDRLFMESHFGYDFSQVRIHNDERALETAEAINAIAYTIGTEIVIPPEHCKFGESSYKWLLAHELTHVIQQGKNDKQVDSEKNADSIADLVSNNGWINEESIEGTNFGLLKKDKEKKTKPLLTAPSLWLNLDELYKTEAFQLSKPSLIPEEKEKDTPKLPSRLPFLSSGRFSFGVTLDFPDLEVPKLEGAPDSGLKEALAKGKVIKQVLTGRVPSTWEALDKGKLVQAMWGIFSTKIAPDLAKGITRKMSTSTGRGGASIDLDLVIFTDFSGGGLSLTVKF
jgi:hypothetical protein